MNSRRIGEFDLIERFFAPLATDASGAFSLKDDAALLAPLAHGQAWAITTDMMVEGRHWLVGSDGGQVAGKLLRVNLSDLAAMGAKPKFYTLALALSDAVDDNWVQAFASGLGAGQKQFSVTLIGGDTVATPGPVTATLTAMGVVNRGMELRRSGAGEGDGVFVTGTIGDGALGLALLRGELDEPSAKAKEHLVRRHQLPDPRTEIGPALAGVASACVDISDGLVQDLGHIASTSGVAIHINANAVPLSKAAREILIANPKHMETVLSGGDDYELAFTAPKHAEIEIAELAEKTGVPIEKIGSVEMQSSKRVVVFDANDQDITPKKGGFSHF